MTLFKGGILDLSSYPLRIETRVRSAPSPFHHLQLLPALASVRFSSLKESLRKDFGRGARPLRIFAGRICGHAGAYSSAHQRTRQRNPFHRDASLEAARLAPATPQATEKGAFPTTQTPLPGCARFLTQFWQPRFYDFTGAGSTWSPPEIRPESD